MEFTTNETPKATAIFMHLLQTTFWMNLGKVFRHIHPMRNTLLYSTLNVFAHVSGNMSQM